MSTSTNQNALAITNALWAHIFMAGSPIWSIEEECDEVLLHLKVAALTKEGELWFRLEGFVSEAMRLLEEWNKMEATMRDHHDYQTLVEDKYVVVCLLFIMELPLELIARASNLSVEDVVRLRYDTSEQAKRLWEPIAKMLWEDIEAEAIRDREEAMRWNGVQFDEIATDDDLPF